MADTYKLTYFSMKGLGEPIRLLFAYIDVPYEDHRIDRAEFPDHKKDYLWGQLPVLQVGDRTLAQSNAILRYLGQKHNLGGTNEWETAKIDELADAVVDFRAEWGAVLREPDEGKKAELKASLMGTYVPKFCGNLEKILSKNEGSPYLVGKTLTWVDLLVAHYLEMLEVTTDSSVLDHYHRLNKLKKTVFSTPKIKAWIDKRPKTQF